MDVSSVHHPSRDSAAIDQFREDSYLLAAANILQHSKAIVFPI